MNDDDLNIDVDADIMTFVEAGKLDQWQAGQIQLRRDLQALQKKMADEPGKVQLTLSPRRGGPPVVGSR